MCRPATLPNAFPRWLTVQGSVRDRARNKVTCCCLKRPWEVVSRFFLLLFFFPFVALQTEKKNLILTSSLNRVCVYETNWCSTLHCRVWRPGPRLQLQCRRGRGAGQHPVRRHPNGHRRPVGHGHSSIGQVQLISVSATSAVSPAQVFFLSPTAESSQTLNTFQLSVFIWLFFLFIQDEGCLFWNTWYNLKSILSHSHTHSPAPIAAAFSSCSLFPRRPWAQRDNLHSVWSDEQ